MFREGQIEAQNRWGLQEIWPEQRGPEEQETKP